MNKMFAIIERLVASGNFTPDEKASHLETLAEISAEFSEAQASAKAVTAAKPPANKVKAKA